MWPRVSSDEGKYRRQELARPPWEPPVRLKINSNERKCHCQKLTLPPWAPLIHHKPSRSERKYHCQRLARQPWEPPLRLNFRSNERKYRCQKLTHRLWEPLIRLTLSRNEGKCCCLRLICYPLPSQKPLPQPLQPPLCPASHSPRPHCRLPHRLPLPPTPLAALCYCRRRTSLQRRHLVRCHNPWPAEDALFCPGDALPAFVTGIPAISSGPELWVAVHNHRPEPLQLHSGQNIGVLEVVTLADTPPTAS